MASDLLDRRFLAVIGKGGTGKTTVAASLAVLAASRGKRVLVASVCTDEVATSAVLARQPHPLQPNPSPTAAPTPAQSQHQPQPSRSGPHSSPAQAQLHPNPAPLAPSRPARAQPQPQRSTLQLRSSPVQPRAAHPQQPHSSPAGASAASAAPTAA